MNRRSTKKSKPLHRRGKRLSKVLFGIMHISTLGFNENQLRRIQDANYDVELLRELVEMLIPLGYSHAHVMTMVDNGFTKEKIASLYMTGLQFEVVLQSAMNKYTPELLMDVYTQLMSEYRQNQATAMLINIIENIDGVSLKDKMKKIRTYKDLEHNLHVLHKYEKPRMNTHRMRDRFTVGRRLFTSDVSPLIDDYSYVMPSSSRNVPPYL